MSATEENKAVIRRRFEVMWNQGDLSVAREFIAPDAIDHGSPPGTKPGPEGQTQVVTGIRNAFPDVQATVEDQIAENDKVVSRWSMVATHQGEFMGIPPTGKRVHVTGITINRVADGMIQEGWTIFDQLGLLQQIGGVPTPDAEVARSD